MKEQLENLEIMLERKKLSHETDKQQIVSVIDTYTYLRACTCAVHDVHYNNTLSHVGSTPQKLYWAKVKVKTTKDDKKYGNGTWSLLSNYVANMHGHAYIHIHN